MVETVHLDTFGLQRLMVVLHTLEGIQQLGGLGAKIARRLTAPPEAARPQTSTASRNGTNSAASLSMIGSLSDASIRPIPVETCA